MIYVRYLLFLSSPSYTMLIVCYYLLLCILRFPPPFPIFVRYSFRAVDRRRLPTRSYYLCFLPTPSLSWFSWDSKWNLQHKRICIHFPHFITLLQFSAIKILLQIQSLILQPTTAHILLLLPSLSLSIGIQIFIKRWKFPLALPRFFFAASFFWFCGSFSISTYDRMRWKNRCAFYSIWNSIFGWQRNAINIHFNMLIGILIEFVKIAETFTSSVYPYAWPLPLSAATTHISDRLTLSVWPHCSHCCVLPWYTDCCRREDSRIALFDSCCSGIYSNVRVWACVHVSAACAYLGAGGWS